MNIYLFNSLLGLKDKRYNPVLCPIEGLASRGRTAAPGIPWSLNGSHPIKTLTTTANQNNSILHTQS